MVFAFSLTDERTYVTISRLRGTS